MPGHTGSGKTFGWEQDGQDEMCCAVRAFREKRWQKGLLLWLQGGLNAENVAEGIRIFAPMSQMSAAAWKRCATERWQKI